jgi:hypothetical protein
MTDPSIPGRGYNTKDVQQQDPAAPKRPGFFRRHWGKLTVFALVGIPVLSVIGWTVSSLTFTYSSGERVGYVQKISKKGWICKTWEGELQMSNVPGSAPILFYFTVWNDSIAKAISAAEGQRVSLEYREHLKAPTSCFGDTQHVVSGMRPLAGPS